VLVQSLPVPEPQDFDDQVLLMTTGLNKEHRDYVTESLEVLGWSEVDEFTDQGVLTSL